MMVNKEDVFKQLKNDQVVILNVLSKSDFKKLRIHPSENHTLTDDPKLFSKEVREKFGKDKSFIVYGDHFGLLESYEAAKALTDDGANAVNYSGGVQEWYKAGFPVEGTEVKV